MSQTLSPCVQHTSVAKDDGGSAGKNFKDSV